MKKHLKKLSLLFAVAMVLIVSCSKEEDKAIEPIASTFTVYKNQTGDVNADALQAQNIDSKGILNFYGAFDSENNPIATKTLTYQKANNDTIVNLIINPLTNRLTSSYFSVKGVKSPIIMKFDYIDNSKNIDVSFYNYNWTTETSDLIYASRIENNNGVVTENPFFASKKNMLPTFLEGTLALGTGLAVAEIVGLVAGTFTLSAAAAPVIAAVLATQIVTYAAVGVAVFLISNLAGAAEIDYPPSNSPPKSNTPMINPVSATSNPTSKLQPSSCVNTQMTFRASMDAEGSIMITEVAGGQSPHTYLVSSGFQQSQVFPNKYKDGSYVVGVKDANGCVSTKLIPLSRPGIVISNASWSVDTNLPSHICCKYIILEFNFQAGGISVPSSGGNSDFSLNSTFPVFVDGTLGTYVNQYGSWSLVSGNNQNGRIRWGMSIHTGEQAEKKQSQVKLNFNFLSSNNLTLTVPL